MQQIPGEPFVAGIVMIGIGVIVGLINIRAAFMLVGIIMLTFSLILNTGSLSQHLPFWLFWLVLIVIGINLLKTFLSVLFGQQVAGGVISGLISGILAPLFALFTGLIRMVFGMRRG